jgi:glycosyltransferase involved in cell wall biosynthesis
VGGAQDNTFLTVEGLPRDRYEVHLAGAPGGSWQDRAESVADQLFLIPSLKRGTSVGQNLQALVEIRALLKRQKYDIVHTHSTNAGIFGRYAAKLAGTPLIVHTVHGFPFNDLTLSPTTRTVLIWLERLAALCSDCLIMVSELNKIEALKKRITLGTEMVTIYSGIDLSRFVEQPDVATKRKVLGFSESWPIVGMVGRLAESNAPDVFIQAAKRVLAERPNLYFAIVGDGPLRSTVEALTVDVPQCKILGYRSDIPQILPLFDIYVAPVLWGGLGRALTEAMVTGRPVVASAVNGVPEIVHHGETGLLVPPNDPDAIAREVCYLLDHPERAKQLGVAGQALVVPKFGAEQMVTGIATLYENLLLRKGLIQSLPDPSML